MPHIAHTQYGAVRAAVASCHVERLLDDGV